MNPRFPQEEPSADLRTAARAAREMYVALVHEGFTEDEALTILGHVIKGATGGGG